MESLIEQIQGMVERVGFHAYLGVAGIIVLWITGFISFFMLIYSLFSHNWESWKYIKKTALIGVGLIVLSIIISFIAGFFGAMAK